jgi:hypothetical protein
LAQTSSHSYTPCPVEFVSIVHGEDARLCGPWKHGSNCMGGQLNRIVVQSEAYPFSNNDLKKSIASHPKLHQNLLAHEYVPCYRIRMHSQLCSPLNRSDVLHDFSAITQHKIEKIKHRTSSCIGMGVRWKCNRHTCKISLFGGLNEVA